MKKVCSLLLLLILSIPVAQAATCRAGEAAVRGGQAGYESDSEAADETADESLSFADVLEQCVGSITGARTSPTFGGISLGDMVGELFDKVCRVAREKVSGAMGDDRKQRMAAALANIYKMNQASGTPMFNPSTNGQNSGIPATTTATEDGGSVGASVLSNLQDIWR